MADRLDFEIDVELETIAQTWSEHCSHKTLKGIIDCDGKRYENLLKETIFGATQEIRRRLGPDDWCVSVFEDNAGVVRFDEKRTPELFLSGPGIVGLSFTPSRALLVCTNNALYRVDVGIAGRPLP